MVDYYAELAESTDGKVVAIGDDISLLTDQIMARFDSLPRVEEEDTPLAKPSLSIVNTEDVSGTEFKVSYESDAPEVLVILNDEILGKTPERTLTIGELDRSGANKLMLVPIKDGVKGAGVEVEIPGNTLVPKAPNTGQR